MLAYTPTDWRNISNFRLGEQMGEVIQFIPKRDLERARLIQEARAIYESIFPSETTHCNNRDLGTVSPTGASVASTGKTEL